MEVIHYKISDEIDVFATPLIHCPQKRESEKTAAQQLVKYIFGEAELLLHKQGGEPYLQNNKCHISISHNKRHLCIAISKQIPVGIDIEDIGPRLNRVRHKFLSDTETYNLPQHGSLTELALCWSAKEAIYKINNAEAGCMGENIAIQTEEVGLSKHFTARIKKRTYTVQIVDKTEQQEIVIAWELEKAY